MVTLKAPAAAKIYAMVRGFANRTIKPRGSFAGRDPTPVAAKIVAMETDFVRPMTSSTVPFVGTRLQNVAAKIAAMVWAPVNSTI